MNNNNNNINNDNIDTNHQNWPQGRCQRGRGNLNCGGVESAHKKHAETNLQFLAREIPKVRIPSSCSGARGKWPC